MIHMLHNAAGKFRGGHVLAITAVLALAVAMLVVLAPAAVGAAPSCAVSNTRDHKGFSSVQSAVNAAKAGDTLEIKGTCFGPTTVDKNLTLKGVVNKTFPDPPIISGRLTPDTAEVGTTLAVNSGVSATVTGLTIKQGASLLNSHFVTGGGDVSWVNIGGALLPPTSGTEDYVFVGRACNGDTLLANPSGKVAVAVRGGCFFSDKGANAAAAGATATVIYNTVAGGGAWPQATTLVAPVTIPVVGISNAAGVAMGSSGTLTWTNWAQNGFLAQGCGGGVICNSGTLALVDSVVTLGRGTFGGGIYQNAGALTLAGTTSISGNTGTFGGGIGHPAGTVSAADGTSTYKDPLSGATLPAWTGSISNNFIGECNPQVTLGSFTCSP
jgi:PA domain-containing protein